MVRMSSGYGLGIALIIARYDGPGTLIDPSNPDRQRYASNTNKVLRDSEQAENKGTY